MKKKILSVFIACVMVFAMIPMTTAGAEEVSIPISNRAELEAIADNLGGTYHLTADIVLSGAQAGDWVPLGSSTAPFTGTLDGRGFEIRGLRISGDLFQPGPPNAGLFSHISGAHIKNLGMVNTHITAGSASASAGAIAARAQGERSFITNCYNTGSVNAVVMTSALVVISLSAGGLVGIAQADSLTISSSYNTGRVFASADRSANSGGGTSTTVTAGGIIGEMYTGSGINDCYNRGDITANIRNVPAGGSGSNTQAGGIVGVVASVIVFNTYNTGTIQSTNPQTVNRYVGEIFGRITGLIFAQNNHGNASSGTNFTGFDFTNVWRRISGVNDNLPVLRAFYNFCAVCDRDPCVCVVAPDLCIECKKEICVCCPDCNTDPCACIDAPDLCIECKKEICECNPEPKVCTLCNETPCECGVVAIAPGSCPVVSVIIAPKTKISIGGGEPFEADADKLTLKVVKNTPTSGEAGKFFAALKDYLSS